MPKRRTLFSTLLVATLVLTFAPSFALAQVGSPPRVEAIVLVNSTSGDYSDFEHFVQPYLDHFGIPYTVLDIAVESVGIDIDEDALIIIGHRQLDPAHAFLDSTEECYISAAVSAGTGLVNFDNDLSAGGTTPRYQFIQDIFDFGYLPPSAGAGVTFTSETGGGLQINCWEDDHQDPVLTTFTNASLFDDEDGLWDEFLWLGHRDYPGVFAGIPEATDDTLGTFHCFGDVPNGTYDVIANLYHSRNWRYYWGYTVADPQANSYDVTTGPSGDFAEFEIDTITITDGSFDIYMNYGEDLGGTAFPYFGWSWIRLVPTSAPPPVMHYITERHSAGESIGTGSMTMAGITLPEGATALAMTGSQPFLATVEHGTGHAVQWGSYDWMSHSVKGPVYGLDDLVWRSIVWAARKPFVMQGLPPFLTMRVDDESGPFGWIEIANEFGIKPWAGLFYYNIDDTEAAQLSTLVNADYATASVHAKTGAFFYYNHGVGDFPDAEIEANYAHATAWHSDHNIPISKFVLPHFYEFGTNIFQGLSDWGVEFVGTMMDPGNGYGASWIMNGPYRLYETGGSSQGRPVYYADFMSIPGHPEFDGQFFNCVTEIRDDAGYEWYPSNDVAGSIGRGTRQSKRALDSMALATLFTHGYYTHGITPDNWRGILQGITDNLAEYDPIYVTLDHACQYVRAMHTSDIAAGTYDPVERRVTTEMSGETDMPTMFYLFTEQAGDIHQLLIDVPIFSGATTVNYTLAGPLDHIVVSPASTTVATGGTQQFTAQGYDADDNPIPSLPFTWFVSGGGAIDGSGLFTAGLTPGTYEVEASFGGVSGIASVEVVAPALDHFAFEPIASPQYVDAPFQVTITARDISGNPLAGYFGTAALSDSTGTLAPTTTGSFSGGVWTGEVTVGQVAHDVTLTASDGDANGTSEPFEVLPVPMFYQVTSPAYESLEDEAFPVTVTAYEGTTINLWEDDHQDPVLATTTDLTYLETTPGEWTEYHHTGRPFPSVMAAHDEYELYGLPLMHFYASGIPNGEYEVIANLYESAPMRYFYGFTPGDPFAHYVDTPGGAPGTQHREHSLGTLSITDGTFNLYVQDADILGGSYPIFGWAWVRLVPVESETQINLWEDDHQDPILETTSDVPTLISNGANALWTEFLYTPSRPYPSILASALHTMGLGTMHFYAHGIPNGPYEVIANLYDNAAMRYFYGFAETDPQAHFVEVPGGATGEQHNEYNLGVVEITDNNFDLYTNYAELIAGGYEFFGWAWIRLVPAGLTMSSSSPTMLFDGDGDGIFGEPADDVKPLVDGSLTIMARDTTAGTGVTIVATDVLGRFGYNTYTILSLNEPPVADAGGPYTYIDEGDSVTLDASGSSDPDDNIVLYEWDLDDDGEYDDATGVTTDVVFDDNGTFTVGLRVTDEFGESDTDTAEVTVDNVAPTATFNAPSDVDEGADINLSLTDPYDPSPVDTFEYAFDCGDGGGYGAWSATNTATCPTTDNATRTVKGRIKDKDGGETEYTGTVPVNNVAPTATFNYPVSVNEGDDINLSLSDAYDPSSTDTAAGFEYAFDCGDGSGYGSYSSADSAVCPTTDNGSRTVKGKIRDKDGGETEYTAEVTVNNVAPVVTVNIDSQTVQYSDYICDVIFTATDVAAEDLTATTSALPGSLTLTDNGCSVSGGTRTCTWMLEGTMDQPVGDYRITVTVTDDDGGSVSAYTTITVLQEDADIRLYEDNTVAVQVDSPGGDSPAFSLTAYVQETVPDEADCGADPGGISNAEVEMTLAAVGPGSSYPVTCTPVGVTGTGYDAILEVRCDFDNVDVNTYHVQAAVVGDYYIGGPDEDVLVVFDPSLGFTTGGGWFYWPGTTEKTNFGYTMKYNKTGRKVRGSLLLIRHMTDGSIYRVKSNALYGLALGESTDPPFGWASFSGKCTYLEPGWPEPIGSHEFLVYVEDYGELGRGVDQFWIEVYDKDGNVIDAMSMDRPADGHTETLGGGNIVVPH